MLYIIQNKVSLLPKSITYLLLIALTAFLAAGVYIYKPISGGVTVLTQAKPCSEPMSYSIGEIDTGFAITRDEVKAAAKIAAGLWNSDGSVLLISQSEDADYDADIVINFEYDERQQRTDAELRFREKIKSEQIRLDRRQKENDQRRDRFDAETGLYLELANRTTRELNELNSWVSEKNDAGGFTESEYETFTQRKSAVEQKQKRVIEEREKLDEMAATINREIDELNLKFSEINTLVDRYNEEFAGDMRFTKATYQRRGNRGVITVSQFMGKSELGLILAHEMGHALGIDHLQNPEAIMYGRMGSQQMYPEIQITAEDRSAAVALCK